MTKIGYSLSSKKIIIHKDNKIYYRQFRPITHYFRDQKFIESTNNIIEISKEFDIDLGELTSIFVHANSSERKIYFSVLSYICEKLKILYVEKVMIRQIDLVLHLITPLNNTTFEPIMMPNPLQYVFNFQQHSDVELFIKNNFRMIYDNLVEITKQNNNSCTISLQNFLYKCDFFDEYEKEWISLRSL